jgi:hypothetical protein
MADGDLDQERTDRRKESGSRFLAPHLPQRLERLGPRDQADSWRSGLLRCPDKLVQETLCLYRLQFLRSARHARPLRLQTLLFQ